MFDKHSRNYEKNLEERLQTSIKLRMYVHVELKQCCKVPEVELLYPVMQPGYLDLSWPNKMYYYFCDRGRITATYTKLQCALNSV